MELSVFGSPGSIHGLVFSVAGTRDYRERNRQRWKAYNYLNKEQKIPLEKINAGFEVNCWGDGQAGWREFMIKGAHPYLIQFNAGED